MKVFWRLKTMSNKSLSINDDFCLFTLTALGFKVSNYDKIIFP